MQGFSKTNQHPRQTSSPLHASQEAEEGTLVSLAYFVYSYCPTLKSAFLGALVGAFWALVAGVTPSKSVAIALATTVGANYADKKMAMMVRESKKNKLLSARENVVIDDQYRSMEENEKVLSAIEAQLTTFSVIHAEQAREIQKLEQYFLSYLALSIAIRFYETISRIGLTRFWIFLCDLANIHGAILTRSRQASIGGTNFMSLQKKIARDMYKNPEKIHSFTDFHGKEATLIFNS